MVGLESFPGVPWDCPEAVAARARMRAAVAELDAKIAASSAELRAAIAAGYVPPNEECDPRGVRAGLRERQAQIEASQIPPSSGGGHHE